MSGMFTFAQLKGLSRLAPVVSAFLCHCLSLPVAGFVS